MLRWLKSRVLGPQPTAADGAVRESRSEAAHDHFRIEQLEPRVLLSADLSLAAVISQSLLDDDDAATADVLELDAASRAELTAEAPSEGSVPGVSWGRGWSGDASAGTADDAGDSALPAAPAAPGHAAPAALMAPEAADFDSLRAAFVGPERAARPEASPQFGGDAPQLFSNPFDAFELARGPPAPVDSGDHSFEINHLHAFSPSHADVGDRAFRHFGAASAAALTTSQGQIDLADTRMAAVFDQVRALWASAGVAGDLLARLDAVTLAATDLPGGQLAWFDGDTITLDADAAGRGWFVDPTPADHAEFGFGSLQSGLIAGPGSPARGAQDLLTVLAHEFGHAIGLDHDAGLALMAAHLTHGQRLLPAA